MNETNEMWRITKAQRRARLDRKEGFRRARLQWLLGEGEIVQIRTLGEHGVRLIHYEWPQREHFIDYWPRTGTFCVNWNGTQRYDKGWWRLLAALGFPKARYRAAAKVLLSQWDIEGGER